MPFCSYQRESLLPSLPLHIQNGNTINVFSFFFLPISLFSSNCEWCLSLWSYEIFFSQGLFPLVAVNSSFPRYVIRPGKKAVSFVRLFLLTQKNLLIFTLTFFPFLLLWFAPSSSSPLVCLKKNLPSLFFSFRSQSSYFQHTGVLGPFPFLSPPNAFPPTFHETLFSLLVKRGCLFSSLRLLVSQII